VNVIHRLRRLSIGILIVMTAGAKEGTSSESLSRWVGSATADRAMVMLREDLSASVRRGSPVPVSTETPWPCRPTGVFVSLLRDGRVMGCMGSFEPPAGDLYTAVLQTAWRAMREDIRSRPLRAEDLSSAGIVVTFVGRPTPIPNPDSISPWQEGLLAVQEGRSAVVVPGEAKTTRYAVRLALRNSGLDPDGIIEYSRFEAVTWREGESSVKTEKREDWKGSN
jgi:AMMECR1 domain-containing protein